MSFSISAIRKSLDRPLYYTSLIHLVIAGLCLLALLFDDRVLLDLPVWIKPFKFAISIAVYSLTLAYLVPFLQSRVARNIISYGTVLCMFVEMVLIGMQAARGVKSHFNIESTSGIVIYSVMGVFIASATLLLIYLAIEYLRKPPVAWLPSFRLAVQLGLWFTVVGCVVGGYMSGTTGHTVGGPDGGAGLPLLNWSTVFGDWRVAHFLGLHALQVFMLAGWWSKAWHRANLFLWSFAVAYGFMLAVVIWLTVHAKSIFSI